MTILNNDETQPLFLSDISSHYENKNYKCLKYGMICLFLNTTTILVISSILFYQINMFYNDFTSLHVIDTFSQINNIINNTCSVFPEICYH